MTYTITNRVTRDVKADYYIRIITKNILDNLEMLEALKGNDILKAAGAIDEISGYVESLQETIGDLEPAEDDSPYAERTVEENHEHKTLCAKYLNRG